MQAVNKAMGQTVKGMSSAMKSMKVEQIASTMEEFEKQFEDMDVKSGFMESAMEASTSLSTPPEDVDRLIQMVADEHGLKVSTQLDVIGTVGTTVPQTGMPRLLTYIIAVTGGNFLFLVCIASAAPKDDFESRLAALRK